MQASRTPFTCCGGKRVAVVARRDHNGCKSSRSINDVFECEQCPGQFDKDLWIPYEVWTLQSLCCLYGLSMSCSSCYSVPGYLVLLSD